MLSVGLEPTTLALLAPCSTDWAMRAFIFILLYFFWLFFLNLYIFKNKLKHNVLLINLIHLIKIKYFNILFKKKSKQRREVSINRPVSYEPTALPLRHPAFTFYYLLFLFIFYFLFFIIIFLFVLILILNLILYKKNYFLNF